MKTRSTSRPDAAEERRNAGSSRPAAQMKPTAAAVMPDARAASLAQLRQQEQAGNSTQAAQLKAHAELMAGGGADAPLQRVEDDELLQGKFDVAQREEDEDEELLQGKFEPAQRMDEDELLQGKFEALQRKEVNTSLQGEPVQAASGEVPVQRQTKPNDTGLPDQLKSGIESLSGMSMDHVKVHYNSDKPGQLQAHAYAQGSEIHVAPGQERHVPHEAWHVVQQAQGRVKPTMQMKAGVPVNDDVALETEADVMGAKAAMHNEQDALFSVQRAANTIVGPGTTVQKMSSEEYGDLALHFEKTCTLLGLAYDEDASWAWAEALSHDMAENDKSIMSLSVEKAMQLYAVHLKANSTAKTPARMIAGVDRRTVQQGKFINRVVEFKDGWRLEHITIEGYAPDDSAMVGAVFAHAQIRKADSLKNYYMQLEPETSEIGEVAKNQAQQDMNGKTTAWKASEIPADVREGVMKEMRLIAY